MIRILVAASPGEQRIAVCERATLQDYTIYRAGAPDGFGDILAGRLIARVPAMAGSFVALPGQTGFLPDTAAAGPLPEGSYITVRVTRSAQGGKGPRLALASLPPVEGGGDTPPHAPTLLQRGRSPLHVLAAAHPDAEIEVDDPGLFASLRPAYAVRLRLVPAAFDDELEAEIEKLGEAWADLPGGMRAGFFPTPALTAIDLDGFTATAAQTPKAAAQFAANLSALPALATAIRLRNLSGVIMVDFAGVPIKRRAALGPALAGALAQDPARPRLAGFSNLGLAEILRPRTTPPLHELLHTPHAAALAALRRMLRGPAVPKLRAAPPVIAALQADPVALPAFHHRTGLKPVLQSDPTLPTPGYVIEDGAPHA